MSDRTLNVYSHSRVLNTKEGATAAAIDLISKACSADDNTHKIQLLEWINEGDNLKTLRDKIISSASE